MAIKKLSVKKIKMIKGGLGAPCTVSSGQPKVKIVNGQSIVTNPTCIS